MSEPKVMEARYAGTCGTCKADIKPGDRINWGGHGAVSCEGCPVPEPAPKSSGAGRRGGGRGRSGYGRSRGRYAPRPRGTCEDAPCCGCCGVWD